MFHTIIVDLTLVCIGVALGLLIDTADPGMKLRSNAKTEASSLGGWVDQTIKRLLS